ncbi:uncharacterized protein LOC126835640 [Adelges cooleyi]|uniref:uncharacterized protein LOC126835640 n=1 Tax=Adelges cooleyi TaxID=133065 RepID=UPI0021800491|nr:uncharacterized protein LOC126835640 [Adelges cooleyi]
MKLFCFMTSLIIVNVSSDEPMDYQTNMAITNAYVKQASEFNVLGPNFVENGLEQVIKTIIGDDNTYSLGAILNMIAIPESATNQRVFREKIQSELGIGQLQVLESDYRPLGLYDLGSRRRTHTRQALINIYKHSVVGFEGLFSELWICRMIALFVSAKFPILYIRNIQAGPNTCITFNGVTTDTYSKVRGEWRQFVGNINFMSLDGVFVY